MFRCLRFNSLKVRCCFAAYNTSGVVNPAFDGSREILIDMPPSNKGEVKIDMDGDPSVKPPTYNGDVKIDMDGDTGIKTPSGTRDVKLDMDWDPTLPDGNRPELSLPGVSRPSLDLPDHKSSRSNLPGADADVVIKGPAKPTFDEEGATNLVSKY